MRALFVFLALTLGVYAEAGENKYLGVLTSTGTSVNNTSTAVPFVVPAGAQLTLFCDTANARYLSDQSSTAASGATKGAPIPSQTLFPTSVGGIKANLGTTSTPTAWIALISTSGTTNCDVWARSGTE
jgi:hypothetical protein